MNQYVMQARSSVSGAMVMWQSATPDWAAAGFPGPGTAQDVAVSSVPVSGGTPGGSDGQAQYKSGSAFAGTANLTVVGGELVHKGSPVHRETPAVFGDPSGTDTYGYAKPYWKGAQTTSTADTVIASIDIPLALGDVGVTIQFVSTFDHTSGTGMVSRNLVIRRRGGAWTVVNERDTSDPGDTEIVASIRCGQPDNHTITAIATGIAGNLDWMTSAHVHIVKKGV